MSELIEFKVLGKPMGKQRPRFSRRGRFTTTYTPQKTMDYEENVRQECIKAMQLTKDYGWFNEEPLQMSIVANYEIPKSYSKKKIQLIQSGKVFATKKPDVDNIFKIVADSLNGVAYKDDSQIIWGSVLKKYSSEPCVEVLISKVEKIEEGEK